MSNDQIDFDEDFDFDENEEETFSFRKPTDSRRKLEEYMEMRELQQYLADDYDYDFDEYR